MIAMNERMRRELRSISLGEQKLAPELQGFLIAGFVEINGCFLIKSLKELCLTISEENFPDKTGFECFVNSVHVDDFVASDYLANAILFVDAAFQEWRNGSLNSILQAIVCKDEFGALVKLHLCRIGESWVGRNLEGYEDAMFVADSTETNFHWTVKVG